MAIKRNITDISALKRGANNVTAVYRGNTLIWPTTPPPVSNLVDSYNSTMTFNTLTPTETKYATRMSLYIY